jgi:hypothetical protein
MTVVSRVFLGHPQALLSTREHITRKGIHMRRTLSYLVAAATALWLVGVGGQPASAEGTDPSWATCTAQTVPVTLSATDPTVYTISGRRLRATPARAGPSS